MSNLILNNRDIDIFDRFFGIGSIVPARQPLFTDRTLKQRVVGEDLVVEMDMPGVEKKDLTIDVSSNVVSLIATRDGEEIQRSFTISRHYDPASMTAKLELGVLKLTMPKREESKLKRIELT